MNVRSKSAGLCRLVWGILMAGTLTVERARAEPYALEPSGTEAVDASADTTPSRWEHVALTAGWVDYTTSYTTPFDGTRWEPPDSIVTRGSWVGVEAQFALLRGLALAGRGRFGFLLHEPRSRPAMPPDGGPPIESDSFDPQLGDPALGGSVGLMARFRSKRVVFDVGMSRSLTSFRERATGGGVGFEMTCEDCPKGQFGYDPVDWWPTLRLSRAGLGFYASVATGEGFIHTHERTYVELLVGARLTTWAVMAGFARGLAARAEFAVSHPYWLAVDVCFNPFNEPARGEAFAPLIISVSLSWRGVLGTPL